MAVVALRARPEDYLRLSMLASECAYHADVALRDPHPTDMVQVRSLDGLGQVLYFLGPLVRARGRKAKNPVAA